MGRYVKLAKETNFAEDWTTVPAWNTFLDVLEENFRAENDLQIPPGIWRANRRDSAGRFVGDNGGFGNPLDARTIGMFLYGVLGNVAYKNNTPITGAVEHIFWGANRIPSWRSAIGYDDLMEKKVRGISFNQATLGAQAGNVLQGDYDNPFAVHNIGAIGTDPTSWGITGYPDIILLGFHEAELYLWGTEGADANTPAGGDNRKPTSFEVVVNNNLQSNYVFGQRTVYNAQVQKREITGTVEVIFEDDPAGSDYDAEDEFEKFYGAVSATTPQDVINGFTLALIATSAIDITTGTPHELTLYVPKAKYRTGDVNLAGAGAITQPIAWTAFEPTTAPTDPWDATTHASEPTYYDFCAVLQNDYNADYSALPT